MDRSGDRKDGEIYFQVDRFVAQNGAWYYMTREGTERGPFKSKKEAKSDLSLYIRHQRDLDALGR
ncbi:hypothetical protein MNBD_GAMMA06-367 [hydrothermal vent metagenome]|uniref:DUF6316 domain-containing protein n=1 Tax=hydrothermal vent metagenome TaxID=652676 RepID=A0A3B0W8R7_9ZZZZ